MYPYPLIPRDKSLFIKFAKKRFTPVVDFLVARLGTQQNSSQTQSKFQYQRAYALSHDLKDQLMCYSNNQLQQLQSNSTLVFVNPHPNYWFSDNERLPDNVLLEPQRKFKASHLPLLPKTSVLSNTSVILWSLSFKRFRFDAFICRFLEPSSHIPVDCDSCSSCEPSGVIQTCSRRHHKDEQGIDFRDQVGPTGEREVQQSSHDRARPRYTCPRGCCDALSGRYSLPDCTHRHSHRSWRTADYREWRG
jgi:hypothetical protein